MRRKNIVVLAIISLAVFSGYQCEKLIETYRISQLAGGYQHCKQIGEGGQSCSRQHVVTGLVSGESACDASSTRMWNCVEGKGAAAVVSETSDLVNESSSVVDCPNATRWDCVNVGSLANPDYVWQSTSGAANSDICGDRSLMVGGIQPAVPDCPKIPKPEE